MKKKYRIYFKNENDAESTRLSLQKFNISDDFLDEVVDAKGRYIFVPSSTSDSANTSGLGNPIANLGRINEDMAPDTPQSSENISYMLEFDVNEEDAEKVNTELKKHNCYFEEEE